MDLDLDLRVGTCGWSYQDWQGTFYQRGTQGRAMLEAYARVFDTVEVNSSFYATPPRARVERWAEATPEGFSFSLKLPKAITHEARLEPTTDARDALQAFIRSIRPLGTKLDTLVLQLPPSLGRSEGLPRMATWLEDGHLPGPVAVEARDASWDHPDTYELLGQYGVSWVWSINANWTPPPETTSQRAYVRFIGDRSIDTFSHLQRDPEPAMQTWLQRLEARQDDLTAVRVYANNHFAGFGPATVNAFLRLAGREPRTWQGGGGSTLQKGLDEFT